MRVHSIRGFFLHFFFFRCWPSFFIYLSCSYTSYGRGLDIDGVEYLHFFFVPKNIQELHVKHSYRNNRDWIEFYILCMQFVNTCVSLYVKSNQRTCMHAHDLNFFFFLCFFAFLYCKVVFLPGLILKTFWFFVYTLKFIWFYHTNE